MNLDPQDPRIQQLLAALKQRQPGHSGPLFGGINAHGTGGGMRGLANYFKPGFTGINYNPLSAQMGRGAPGILGLRGGGDLNPAHPIAPGPDQIGGPAVGGNDMPLTGGAPTSSPAQTVDPNGNTVLAGSGGAPLAYDGPPSNPTQLTGVAPYDQPLDDPYSVDAQSLNRARLRTPNYANGVYGRY